MSSIPHETSRNLHIHSHHAEELRGELNPGCADHELDFGDRPQGDSIQSATLADQYFW